MHWGFVSQWKDLMCIQNKMGGKDEGPLKKEHFDRLNIHPTVLNQNHNPPLNGHPIIRNGHNHNVKNGGQQPIITTTALDSNGNKDCDPGYKRKYPGITNPSVPTKTKEVIIDLKLNNDEVATEDEAESIESTHSSASDLNKGSSGGGCKDNDDLDKINEVVVEANNHFANETRVVNPNRETKKVPVEIHYPREGLNENSEELCDKWRVLFDQFDPEGFGEIPWPDFKNALRSKEFKEVIPPGKILLLEDLSTIYSAHSSAITFQHFVNINALGLCLLRGKLSCGRKSEQEVRYFITMLQKEIFKACKTYDDH